MEAEVEEMEGQLKLWGVKIDKLAAEAQLAGARARFDDLIYIDELKALLAIAQTKLDQFSAAGAARRVRLRAEMKSASNELEAAFTNPRS